jgi:hypothetical protein
MEDNDNRELVILTVLLSATLAWMIIAAMVEALKYVARML